MRLHNGHILGTAALAAPTVAVFAPLGLAPLLSLAAVGALGTAWHGGRLRALVPEGPPLLLGMLLLWSAASLLWAMSAPVGLEKLPRFAGLIASGAIVAAAAAAMDEAERPVFGRMLIAGVGAALVLLTFERATGGVLLRLAGQGWDSEHMFLIGFNRGATVLALMVWPAAMLLFRRHPVAAVLVVGAAFVLFLTLKSNSALFGLAIGAVAFAAARIAPRRVPWLVGAAAIVYILASPVIHAVVLTPQTLRFDHAALEAEESLLPRSSYHRLLIWNFTAERILERPLLGWGLDASRVIPGGEAMLDRSEQALPLHPHSGPLQIWLELGAVGALLAAGFAALLIRRIRAWPVAGASPEAATALFATGFVIVCVSYGLWQSWWLAALFFAGAFCAAARAPAEEQAAEEASTRAPDAAPELPRR